MSEWNEADFYYHERAWRGGSFGVGYGTMNAAWRISTSRPTSEGQLLGFRLSLVPEPATLTLLVLSGVAMLRRRKSYRLASARA